MKSCEIENPPSSNVLSTIYTGDANMEGLCNNKYNGHILNVR